MKIDRNVVLAAALSSAITLVGVWAARAALPVSSKVVLENAKVRVSHVDTPVAAVRARGVRGTDQVIVFLDDCRYERLDPATGEKTVRERKAGDVIWHDKGEDAPQLTNAGSKPYRQVLIELK